MYDGGTSNIASVGHRRWVLNPAMTQTGFGAVGAYANMYAFGKGGSSITDYVAWPARNMPIELMNGSGTPWTLSLGTDYQMAQQGQVTVTLKDVSSGKNVDFFREEAGWLFCSEHERIWNAKLHHIPSQQHKLWEKFTVSCDGHRS